MTKRKQINPRVRERIFIRDGNKCVYCGVSGKDYGMTLDHIKPLAKGGSNKKSNLITACALCNRERGTIDYFVFIQMKQEELGNKNTDLC